MNHKDLGIYSYTNKKYWDNYWEKEARVGVKYSFYFEELLDQYIIWDRVNNYMEIGGAPGSILAYMHNKHALRVSTVDFTDKERISAYMQGQGIDNCNIINQDFKSFDVSGYRKKFGIVASWGFIEHFESEVAAEFIEKKKEMIADGGYLIVELPNIRKLIWLIFYLFNRKIIKTHNLDVMDLKWLKNEVSTGEQFEILYASYYFAMNVQNEYFAGHPRTCKLCKHMIDFFQKRNFSDGIKRWFYPYIVIIAKTREVC